MGNIRGGSDLSSPNARRCSGTGIVSTEVWRTGKEAGKCESKVTLVTSREWPQGCEAFSRQSAPGWHWDCAGRGLLPGRFLRCTSVRGWVTPRVTAWGEDQWGQLISQMAIKPEYKTEVLLPEPTGLVLLLTWECHGWEDHQTSGLVSRREPRVNAVDSSPHWSLSQHRLVLRIKDFQLPDLDSEENLSQLSYSLISLSVLSKCQASKHGHVWLCKATWPSCYGAPVCLQPGRVIWMCTTFGPFITTGCHVHDVVHITAFKAPISVPHEVLTEPAWHTWQYPHKRHTLLRDTRSHTTSTQASNDLNAYGKTKNADPIPGSGLVRFSPTLN
jgi:hypothetical protein